MKEEADRSLRKDEGPDKDEGNQDEKGSEDEKASLSDVESDSALLQKVVGMKEQQQQDIEDEGTHIALVGNQDLNKNYSAWDHYAMEVGREDDEEAERKKKELEDSAFEREMERTREYYRNQPKPTPYEKVDAEAEEETMWKATLEMKREANELYKLGGQWNYKEAMKLWKSAVLGCVRVRNWRKYQMKPGQEWRGPLEEEVMQTWTSILCNMGQCAINTRDFVSALEYLDGVLEEDPRNVKALYRKAVAGQVTKNNGMALECLEKILEIDGSNSAALSLKQQITRKSELKDTSRSSGAFRQRTGNTSAAAVTRSNKDGQNKDGSNNNTRSHKSEEKERLVSSTDHTGIISRWWERCFFCRRRAPR